MSNPILVEVTRGPCVESVHRGSIIVSDAQGKIVWSCGNGEKPVFPRSTVKAIQALPLLESGIADMFHFSNEEIALAVASHAGEPDHVRIANQMLQKVGRDRACLECGAHWPLGETAARALAQTGATPTALHNNCSGKHAGFICLACGLDVDPKGYVMPHHIVQKQVTDALASMIGSGFDADACGTDGCSIPTYAVPLTALAKAFAQIGTGQGLGPERAKAFKRIRKAVAAHPFMVAGTGRFDTDAMTLFGERLFCKTGAEGVYCASLPDQGLGVALKCDDGAERAAQVMMALVISKFLPMSDDEKMRFHALAEPTLVNWNKITVGHLRPVAVFS
jgi:L-asparaginase II